MKNLHLIPTDKPSRLGYLTKKGKEVYKDLRFFDKLMPNILDSENQNIYITNDEEIKKGDYRLNIQRDYFKKSDKEGLDYYNKRNDIFKKIILTTDQDLINDGVQAIDDKFLEWFVKNPSCEGVATKLVEFEVDMGLGNSCIEYGSYYKIVYAFSEPLQELERGITITHVDKQKTLEEAAANLADPNLCKTDNWIAGAKWQQERMYSEEDIIDFAEFVATYVDKNKNVNGEMLHAKSKYDGAERTIDLLKIWLKQFKNK
jgi:hypothetical protein